MVGKTPRLKLRCAYRYFDPESQVAQPDGGDRELCVMLRMTDVRRTAIWHDVVCAFDRVQQYVCEMPQSQVDPGTRDS